MSTTASAIKVSEKPIIFSGPMVRAILEDRKTQTRRICALTITGPNPPQESTFDCYLKDKWVGAFGVDGKGNATSLCPYGKPGDRLIVKETHWRYGSWRKNGLTKTGKQKWTFRAANDEVIFNADAKSLPADVRVGKPRRSLGWWKRPAIFLPLRLARLCPEIAEVRVQRVQEISEEDAIAEGVLECLREITRPMADKAKLRPLHWIHGWDEGLSFCRKCALKKIKELQKENPGKEYILDGGWNVEEDCQEFCETCKEALDCSFTNYAVESEIDHFAKSGIYGPLDCVSIQNIFCSGFKDEDRGRLAKAGYQFLWDSINSKREGGKYAWTNNPWVWAIGFKRLA